MDKPPDSSSLLPLTVLLSYCSAVTAFYLWSNQPVFHEVMFGVICVVLTLLDLKQVVYHKEIFSKRRSLQINEYVFPGPQAPEGSWAVRRRRTQHVSLTHHCRCRKNSEKIALLLAPRRVHCSIASKLEEEGLIFHWGGRIRREETLRGPGALHPPL